MRTEEVGGRCQGTATLIRRSISAVLLVSTGLSNAAYAAGKDASALGRRLRLHSLESFGLEHSVAIGNQKEDKWEARHAVGPALTWRLDEKWRLHDMVRFV